MTMGRFFSRQRNRVQFDPGTIHAAYDSKRQLPFVRPDLRQGNEESLLHSCYLPHRRHFPGGLCILSHTYAL